MDKDQKMSVVKLRNQGETYLQIAAELGVSVNTVKSYCHRKGIEKHACKRCGKPLGDISKRHTKIFCSDGCRMAWWQANRDQLNKKTFYRIICAHCQRPFDSYGRRNRRYCSHACYIAHRFGVP